MDHYEILEKIIGCVEPTRDEGIDGARYKAQEEMIIVMETIVDRLADNARYHNDYSASATKIGMAAYRELREIYQHIGNKLKYIQDNE